jgi:UDP-glucose 4-epimerase
MKIVVTGGLGHIGSALLRQMPTLLPGAEVVIIDNLSTQRYCSLFNLPVGLKHTFVEGSLQSMDLDKHLTGADAVIHLGATTDAAGTAANPNLIFDNNLPATEVLAQSCIKHGVKLLFPSSTSVYGVQEGLVDEGCEDLKPQSPYAECKIQEENIIRQYGDKGLQYCLTRFGTIFGTSIGMRFHTAVNKFCWQAAMGQSITVWSTAMDQKRPYLSLDDGCRFIAFAISKSIFDNQMYNIVTENYTVRQVVDTIRAYVPDLTVKLVDNMIMNQLSYEVSSDKIRQKGFSFHGDLNSAVYDTVSLLRSDIEKKRA